MSVKRIILTLLIATCFASTATAVSFSNKMRRQADSQFRIAEKAYRKAIKDYGSNLVGFPDDEKQSACRKMSSAMHDNRVRIGQEDPLNQQKYTRQYTTLREYAKLLGCVN